MTRPGYSFSHELCTACIEDGEHIIALPTKYQPEERMHDTEFEQGFGLPNVSSHEEITKICYSSAWSATEKCTCCNINS